MRYSSQPRLTPWGRSIGFGAKRRRTAAKLRQAVFSPEPLEPRMLLSFNAHLTAPATGSLNAAYTIDLWTTGGAASKWVVSWGDRQVNTYTSPFLTPQAETHTYTAAPTTALTATATLSTNSFVTSKTAFALSPHFGTGEIYSGSGQTVYSPPSSSPTNNINAPGAVMVVSSACTGGNFIYMASPYDGNEFSITRYSGPTNTSLGGVVDQSWGGNMSGVSAGTFVLPQFGSGGTEVDTPTAMYLDTTDGDLLIVGQVKITVSGVTTYSWGAAHINTSSSGSVDWQTNAGLPSGSNPGLKPNAVMEDDRHNDETDYLAGTDGTHMVVVSIPDEPYSGTPNWTTTVTGATAANTVIPVDDSNESGNVTVGGYTTYTACCSCCGCCTTYTASDFTLVRMSESTGSLDTTFGNHGIVRTNFGDYLNSCCSCCGCCSCGSPSYDSDYSLLEWEDTNSGNWYLIAVGSSNVFGPDEFALARYNESNGSLNTGFGPYGFGIAVPGVVGDAYTAALEGSGGSNTSVETDPNAQIVAAGSNGSDFVVARFTNSARGGGSLDTTFGVNGVFTTDFGSGSSSTIDVAHSIGILTDQNDDGATDILVGGSTNSDDGQMAIADYLPTNKPAIS